MGYELPKWITILNKAYKDDQIKRKKDKKRPKKLSPLPKEKAIKNKKIILELKEGLLWTEFLIELEKLQEGKKTILFKNIRERLCKKFSMSKRKIMECVFFLSELGLIEYVKHRGIRLRYKIKG